MKSFIFTKCPSCGGQMRFDRPETERFAVVCPTCNHLFDAGSDQFNRNLVPAIVLRRGAKPQPVFAPPEPLNVEAFLPPPTAIPVRPINADNGNKRKASAKISRKSPAGRNWWTWNASLGVAVAALLLMGIATSLVLLNPNLRASLGIGKYPEITLVERYSAALDDCQQNLFSPRASTDDPERLLSERLQVLEQLLVDCVRKDPIPNSRHAELRSEMQKLFDSQLKFKESTYSMVPALKGEQRLQFAKLTALISLIELRLSYGLREVPVGSNEIEAYSRKGILLLRDLDRCLLAAKEKGIDKKLKEISSVLDQMEALAIQRIGSGELRGDMPFEYRLMAKACEGWHQWCLESGSDPSSSVVSQAIEKEYTHTWDRYRSAMTVANLPAQEFAAIERIQGRIQIANLDQTSKNLIAKGDSNTVPDRASDSSKETASPQVSATPVTRPDILDFPRPRHQGPSSLCIKVQTSRPEYIKEQAKAVGKLLRLQPDFQVNGGFMTISFGPYSGGLNDVVRKVTFGTIEIIDGQSRTLFVVDQ